MTPKECAKMNCLCAKVEKWAFLTIESRTPASVSFAGIKVSIDSFDEHLDPSFPDNVERNLQPIRFGLMSQWKQGGTGYFVCAENLMEAASEVAKAFMRCVESRDNHQSAMQTPIDEIEFPDTPIQYSFAF